MVSNSLGKLSQGKIRQWRDVGIWNDKGARGKLREWWRWGREEKWKWGKESESKWGGCWVPGCWDFCSWDIIFQYRYCPCARYLLSSWTDCQLRFKMGICWEGLPGLNPKKYDLVYLAWLWGPSLVLLFRRYLAECGWWIAVWKRKLRYCPKILYPKYAAVSNSLFKDMSVTDPAMKFSVGSYLILNFPVLQRDMLGIWNSLVIAINSLKISYFPPDPEFLEKYPLKLILLTIHPNLSK